MRLKNWIFLCLSALPALAPFSPLCPSARAAEVNNGIAERKAVVTESRVNVRGRPSLIGEVVTQLQQGDQVTVLEELAVEEPKAGEPTNWAKIKLPANTPVWVFAPMIKNGAVAVSRLNLRAGPGENYSVLGRLDNGAPVKVIRTVEQWSEIEAPDIAYAFIDGSLIQPLEQNTPAPTQPAAQPAKTQPEIASTAQPQQPQPTPVATPKPAESTPSPAPTEKRAEAPVQAQVPPVQAPVQQAIAPAQQPVDAVPSPASELESAIVQSPQVTPGASPAPVTAATKESSTAPTPGVAQNPETPTPSPTIIPAPGTSSSVAALPQSLPKVAEAPAAKPEQAAPRRIVRREGIIRATKSIQAPTWYELIHPETKATIDFLNEEKLGIKLKDFKGKRVVVTGEEGVDPRWPNTPIIELETLDFAP